MFWTDIYKRVLIDPASRGATRLDVISGYATPAMVSSHLADLDVLSLGSAVEVNLVLGMVQHEGLRVDFHRGFVKIAASRSDFNCWYVLAPVTNHAKVYVWYRDGVPVEAYSGSANYTITAMGRGHVGAHRVEVMDSVDPAAAAAYFSAYSGDVVACDSADVELEVRLTSPKSKPAESELARSDNQTEPPVPVGLESPSSVILPIVQKHGGQVHGPGGGLNHGMRPNRKNKNEAYLPIPAEIARSGFFPPRGQHFLVTTDDDKTLLMSTGSGKPDQPKDLRTPLNNGQLGEYFRHRLAVPSGALIEQAHLDAFGRYDVEFIKLDDETYLMNFDAP